MIFYIKLIIIINMNIKKLAIAKSQMKQHRKNIQSKNSNATSNNDVMHNIKNIRIRSLV